MFNRTSLLWSALAVFLFATAGWVAYAQNLSFDPSGKIWIEGTSNVHGWTCEVKQFSGSVTADLNDGALTGLQATTVTVPKAQLDCDNGQMNRRMMRALNADANPQISFQLTGAQVGQPNNNAFLMQANGRLTLNGTTRNVRFQANGQVLDNGRYQLTGSVPVKMSDFGIDPPTAMLGAMRTGDDVTVHFDVTLR